MQYVTMASTPRLLYLYFITPFEPLELIWLSVYVVEWLSNDFHWLDHINEIQCCSPDVVGGIQSLIKNINLNDVWWDLALYFISSNVSLEKHTTLMNSSDANIF